MATRRGPIDAGAALLGLLLGGIIGALYAITRISKSGPVRRRDLASFGGGTLELEIDASIRQAKSAARDRRRDANQPDSSD